jgi:hypothetical protein
VTEILTCCPLVRGEIFAFSVKLTFADFDFTDAVVTAAARRRPDSEVLFNFAAGELEVPRVGEATATFYAEGQYTADATRFPPGETLLVEVMVSQYGNGPDQPPSFGPYKPLRFSVQVDGTVAYDTNVDA